MRRCQKNVVDDFLSADVETLMVGIKFSDEKKVRDMKWNSWDNNRVFSGNQWLPKVEQQQQIFWNLNGKKMCGAVNLTCRLVWMMDASDLALILVDLFFVLLFFFSPPQTHDRHERKKMYWEQLELRSRALFRRHHPPPCCGCCQDCRFAPASNNPMLAWPAWDVLDDR
jgi:hypothetical protein